MPRLALELTPAAHDALQSLMRLAGASSVAETISAALALHHWSLTTELPVRIAQQLEALPDDETRSDVIHEVGNRICLLCGTTKMPCYCSPHYDE